MLGSDVFGVIVDGPEIEPRAEASEITGVGGRMYALTLKERQAEDEGVARVGGMNVQVAKENLARGFGSGFESVLRLPTFPIIDPIRRDRLLAHRARIEDSPAYALGDPGHGREDQAERRHGGEQDEAQEKAKHGVDSCVGVQGA